MARDLTKDQFKAALIRNGFKYVLGLWAEDTSGKTPGVSYGLIIPQGGKKFYRQSLAHVIAAREQHIARKKAAA